MAQESTKNREQIQETFWTNLAVPVGEVLIISLHLMELP